MSTPVAFRSRSGSGLVTPTQRGLVVPKYPHPVFQRSPVIDPPENAFPFYPNGATVIPAIGATAVICSQTVPVNFSGVIWAIANYTNTGPGIAGWTPGTPPLDPVTKLPNAGCLIWQLLKNGQPYQYLPNIVVIVGLTENGGGKLAVGLRLHANDNIALIVKNVSLAAQGQLLVGSLNGYIYPQEQDPLHSR
jgi:hypothetical protein